MKRIILSIAVIMVAVVASAVTYMCVKTAGEKVVKYDVDKIEQVDYEKDATTSNWQMRTKTTEGKVDMYDVEKVVEVEYEQTDVILDLEETNRQGVSVTGKMAGRTYVDLGLPSGLLWATYNVGADLPTECGDYFAWGETTPKEEYNWDTYKWNKGTSTNPTMTKYYLISATVVGRYYDKTELENQDDAAFVNWGEDWHMPTKEEIQELLNGCDWKIANDFGGTGIVGVIGTSKVNNNVIFFPASGLMEEKDTEYVGSLCMFWSSTLRESADDKGEYGVSFEDFLSLGESAAGLGFMDRYSGACVRGVTISKFTVNFYTQDSVLIESQVVKLNQTATAPKMEDVPGFYFVGWNDSSFLKVQGDINTYVVYEDVSTFKPTTIYGVTVDGKVNGHAYVDLGLPSGTKWAICNVGADIPTESGDGFAWGEVNPKEIYLENNYTVAEDDTIMTPDKDAATVNWGDDWSMPSRTMWIELVNNCSWEIVDNFNGTGVSGNLGTSKINGKKIFFPYNSFWLSTIYRAPYVYSVYARNISELNRVNRYNGYNVRGVVPQKYNVKFYGKDGELIEEQKIPSGSPAIVPKAPEVEGYRFVGWDDSTFNVVTRDMDIYAQYQKIIYYTVNFYSIDSTLIESQKVEEHDKALSVKAPFVDGYVFVAWSDTALSNVQRDMDVYALYIREEDAYKVNFYTAEKKLIDSQKVGKGANVVPPEIPKKIGYDVSWSDSSFTNVQGDLDIYAQYEFSNSGQIAGYHYVDLGLPSGLKWACYNVGATNRTESGDYFAWAETTDKGGVEAVYDWTNYKYEAPAGMTKYNSSDEKNILDASDDAASVIWGSTWRMPTSKEMQELIDGCDWEWVVDLDNCGRNKGGMIGISKYNGKYIYFGAWESPGEGVVVVGGYYWSSNLTANSYDFADCMQFGTTCMDGCEEYEMTVDWHSRTYGASVRAVSK